MATKKKFLVVTDLDSTLLDHNYNCDEAEPALACLRELGLPLVLNSSKTVAEMVGDMTSFFPDEPSSVDDAKVRMTWPSGDLAIVGLAGKAFGCFGSSWRGLGGRVGGGAPGAPRGPPPAGGP